MLLKSLRTNIALNLVLLLLTAMLLIDLVMLMVTQKMFIMTRVEKGHVVLAALESHLKMRASDTVREWRVPDVQQVSRMVNAAGVLCVLVVSMDGRTLYRGGLGCLQYPAMSDLAHKAAITGKSITRTSGFIQGLIGRQPGTLLLTTPLAVEGEIVAGACVYMPTDDIYDRMRRSQHILLIYALINTAILGFLGVYRLNKITIKPIQRLVRRAEAYRDYDDNVFVLEKEDTEFSQLSKSLNRMLMQLAEDKEKLQASVSSLEKANQELEKAQRDLIRAEKLASVGRLSAGIAHEIGNPIGIIKGYLGLLNDESISEEEKADFVSRTESEVERIHSIIQQLLDFARPSGEDQEIVAVHAVLEDLEEVCRFQPTLSCIRFILHLEAQNDRVIANARQLRQVFLNVVLNAADAVRDAAVEGELIIQTECLEAVYQSDKQDRLAIRFRDNGMGIPEETLSNIFDPFYTTKAPGKGTGLGLSVSFTIIEGLGGSIKAEHNENGGTSMVIILPLVVD